MFFFENRFEFENSSGGYEIVDVHLFILWHLVVLSCPQKGQINSGGKGRGLRRGERRKEEGKTTKRINFKFII